MTLPFVEVSHLASSSSFYSAILQPLGLRFLVADREHNSSIGTITYGIPAGSAKPGSKHRKALTDGRGDDQRGGQPVLQIREVTHPFEPVKLSTLVLAVPSPATVVEFHDAALTANPWLHIQTDGDPIYPGGPSPKARLGIEGGETPRRATVRDLDGNTIQVVYRQPQTSRDNFGRVLEWTYDGANQSTHTRTRSQSHPHPLTPARSSSSSVSKDPSPFQPKHGPNTVTAAEMTQRAANRGDDDADPASVSPRQSSNNNGLSTTSVVGALLGVAAGAALTYGFISNATKERDRKPRQEFEPPSMPRRATFPEKAPSVHKMHQEDPRPAYIDYPHPPKTSLRGGEYPHPAPLKALPFRAASNYETFPVEEEDPFSRPTNPRDDFALRRMANPDEYIRRKLGYVDDDSSEESPDDRARPVQYLTQHPHEEENPWLTARDRSRSRTRSRAKSTARSTAKSTTRSTAKSTRSVAKSTARSTARSVAQSRARSHSRAPDDDYELARSHHSSRHPPAEDMYEVVERRSRRSSRAPDDGFDTRSRRSSRMRDDGFDGRSRRSSRPPPEDGFEARSRRSSRPPPTERARSMRSRSEAAVGRKSVVLADPDHHSQAGSRHTVVPKSRSVVRSHRPAYDDERNTYFSARSRPSSRAPRRPPPPEIETEIFEAPEVPEVPEVPEPPRGVDMYEVPEVPEIPDMPEFPDRMPRSRAASRFSVPRMATGPDYPHMGYPGKSQSHISARNIALPMSGVGSSHAQWDDDMVSVAPSDSISCIGSKMSGRRRRVR